MFDWPEFKEESNINQVQNSFLPSADDTDDESSSPGLTEDEDEDEEDSKKKHCDTKQGKTFGRLVESMEKLTAAVNTFNLSATQLNQSVIQLSLQNSHFSPMMPMNPTLVAMPPFQLANNNPSSFPMNNFIPNPPIMPTPMPTKPTPNLFTNPFGANLNSSPSEQVNNYPFQNNYTPNLTSPNLNMNMNTNTNTNANHAVSPTMVDNGRSRTNENRKPSTSLPRNPTDNKIDEITQEKLNTLQDLGYDNTTLNLILLSQHEGSLEQVIFDLKRINSK